MLELSKEQRLLLNAFRVDGKSESSVRDILKENLDWSWILEFAERNRVQPILYNRLKKFYQKNIPYHVMEKLRDTTLRMASRNLLIEHETKKLLERLNGRNIDVIMLKGLVLQEKVYSYETVRPMADIDLLVKKESISEVEQVLVDHGFVFDIRRTSKDACLKRGEHDFPYVKKESKVMVEVHWHLVDEYNPFEIRMEDVWGRAKKTKIGGVDTLMLSLEDLLIYECLHASFQHVFSSAPFRDIVDVSEVLKRFCDEINWDLLVRTCVEWKSSAFAYYVLSLAKRMLNAPVPDDVLGALKEGCSKTQLFGLKLVDDAKILDIKKINVRGTIKFVFLELLWTDNIKDKISITQRAISKMLH